MAHTFTNHDSEMKRHSALEASSVSEDKLCVVEFSYI